MKYPLIGKDTFTAENIRNCEEHILSIQRRLDKAVADNNKKGIRENFDLLTKRSTAVRILATWKITQRNQGKYTAGVDGIALPKGESREHQNQFRLNILSEIDIEKKPDSIRRVFSPKSNGDKRPLGIPTLHDRIIQEVFRTALEPIVEYHFSSNSYGFRPKRNCQDAMSQLFIKLSRDNAPRYVVEGDIKGCFDNINHEHITNTLQDWAIPQWTAKYITQALKSGIFYDGQVYDSETGTPQGGIISPLLANVALTTLDELCRTFHPRKHDKRKTNPIVRYADDFVIVSRSRSEAEEIKRKVSEHLKEVTGLTLSQEKTKITHITKGFNFLGFNFKKYKKLTKGGKVKHTLIIQPQKEKVQQFLKNCKEILNNHKTLPQGQVIKILNPKLRGWGMYYRHVISARTFSVVDGKLWNQLYYWAKKRHPNKSKRWVLRKYFQKSVYRKSHFIDKETDEKLFLLSTIPIKRFIKVNNQYRVYDGNPETLKYWDKREYLNAYDQLDTVQRRKLYRKQKGKCPHCNGRILQKDIEERSIHVHHVKPVSEGGKNNYSNLRLIHADCHREIHSKIPLDDYKKE